MCYHLHFSGNFIGKKITIIAQKTLTNKQTGKERKKKQSAK